MVSLKKWMAFCCLGIALILAFQNCSPTMVSVEDEDSQTQESLSEKSGIYKFMNSHLNEPVTNDRSTIVFKGGKTLEYRAQSVPKIHSQGQISYHDVVCGFDLEIISDSLGEGIKSDIRLIKSKAIVSSGLYSEDICQNIAQNINGFSYQVGQYESFLLSSTWQTDDGGVKGEAIAFNFWQL